MSWSPAPALPQAALQRYEQRLKPSIAAQQRAGRRLAGWFVASNATRVRINDVLTRFAAVPLLWRVVRRAMAPVRLLP